MLYFIIAILACVAAEQSLASTHLAREMQENPKQLKEDSSRGLALTLNLRHRLGFQPDWSWPWSSPPPPPPSRSNSYTGGACSVSAGSGTCMSASTCSNMGYTSYSGACPGPANIECCVSSSSSSTSSSSTSSSSSSSSSSSGSSSGGYGVDLWQQTSSSAWSCLSRKYSFAIVRGFRSTGAPDPYLCYNLNRAASNGFSSSNLDVYFFPCPTCGSASSQMRSMMSTVSACSGSWSGRVWLDIEGSQYWLGSYSKNWAWYKSLVNACMATSGLSCGIYSNQNEWVSLFGGSQYAFGTNLPLWYPRYPYNQSPSLSDYQFFGGWNTPVMKQYVGSTTVCNIGVDLDYAPNFY